MREGHIFMLIDDEYTMNVIECGNNKLYAYKWTFFNILTMTIGRRYQ